MTLPVLYQKYATSILVSVCGATSLASMGYIYVDSQRCFDKTKQYEARMKEVATRQLT